MCVCSLTCPACKAHAAYYMSSVACRALPHFSTLSHNGHEFRGGKKLSDIKCVILIFSTPSVRKISHYTKNRARYYHKCTYWSSCKVPVILFKFSLNLTFLNSFSKNNRRPNSMKIRPVPAKFIRSDGQTKVEKLKVAF